LKWEDILVMPQAELREHIDQFKQWATLLAGGEVKE
jgi:glutaredoxin-related protein